MNICGICLDTLSPHKTILKCSHEFCSRCLLNNVASNVGCEEGTSRNNCPICRAKICPEVLPSATFTIHRDDVVDELENARIKLDYYADWGEERKLQIAQFEERERILRNKLKTSKKDLCFEKQISNNRKSIIHKLFSHIKHMYDIVDDHTFLESDHGVEQADLSILLNIAPCEGVDASDDSLRWIHNENWTGIDYMISPGDINLISNFVNDDTDATEPDEFEYSDSYSDSYSDMDLTPDEF